MQSKMTPLVCRSIEASSDCIYYGLINVNTSIVVIVGVLHCLQNVVIYVASCNGWCSYLSLRFIS